MDGNFVTKIDYKVSIWRCDIVGVEPSSDVPVHSQQVTSTRPTISLATRHLNAYKKSMESDKLPPLPQPICSRQSMVVEADLTRTAQEA